MENEDNNSTIKQSEDTQVFEVDEVKTDDDGWKRNGDGTFGEGNKGGGSKPQTEEEKNKKKVMKEAVEKYLEELTLALKDISPVLKAKALEGDMNAIKEVNDRAMGKSKNTTDVTTNGESLQIGLLNLTNNGLRNNNSNSEDSEDE
jgi:hypothetical protein